MGIDEYDFKEFDVKETDINEFGKKHYEYGPYDDYFGPEAKPTESTHEEFGPGVPAETEYTESKVSMVSQHAVGISRHVCTSHYSA